MGARQRAGSVREAGYTKAIHKAAARLEITQEQAADLVAQIRVYGWEWTPSETRGLTFQDWLDLLELAGKLEP